MPIIKINSVSFTSFTFGLRFGLTLSPYFISLYINCKPSKPKKDIKNIKIHIYTYIKVWEN